MRIIGFKMAAGSVRPSKDKRLDFLSLKFDSLKALYTPELQPPIPNIQIFNNLAEYARVIKEGKAKPPQVFPKSRTGVAGNVTEFTKLLPARARNLKPEERRKAESRETAVQEKLRLLSEAGLPGSSEKFVDGNSPQFEQLRRKAEELVREDQEKLIKKKKKHVNVLEKMEGRI